MLGEKFCKIFGIEKPIVQGGMAWASNACLSAAVSNAGGLGIMGIGFAPKEIARAEIRKAKELTDKPFGVCVIASPGMIEEISEVIIEEKVPVVYPAQTIGDLHYESMEKYIPLWKEAGCKVLAKSAKIDDALLMEKAGADAVVMKGWEGGGHIGYEGSTVIIPLAKKYLSIPVVGCGGFADGKGLAAAFALGADAVEMGTAFLAAEENDIHENAKKEILKAGNMDTVLTGYCTGEPVRQVMNRLAEDLFAIEAKEGYETAAPKIQEAATSSLRKAMVDGDIEYGSVSCGQVVSLVNEIRPASVIIDSALRECEEVLRGLYAGIA